jgi:hypothetical protein
MAAIDGISLKQLDSVIRKHSSSANRFYSDLEGKNLRGDVSKLSLIDPRDLVGEDVHIHGHAPASRAAHLAALRGDIPSPVNIFSVLDRSRKKIGQVTGVSLEGVGGAIDRDQLNKHLDDPEGGKTRNTFITGTVTGGATRRSPGASSLGVKPGRLFIPGEKGDLWEGSVEAGDPTRSGVIGRKASFSAGSAPDRPKAWILR